MKITVYDASQTPNVEEINSLGERDNLLKQIEEQLEMKRNLLVKKQNDLHKKKKDNPYLENVYLKYNEHLNVVRQEKIKQIEKMKMLKQYLDDIIVNEEMSMNDLEELHHERNELLNEMENVKAVLGKIILK
jgi:hypothetical protein